MDISTTSDLVNGGQQTVIIFTRGRNILIREDGTGYSGKWVIAERKFPGTTKVIIYLRDSVTKQKKIYLGDYSGYHPSDIPGRFVVEFSGLTLVGTTNKNWLEFAGKGQNPIGILNG